jgi:hypothetical protein
MSRKAGDDDDDGSAAAAAAIAEEERAIRRVKEMQLAMPSARYEVGRAVVCE